MLDVIHLIDLHNVKLWEKLSLKGGTFPKITDMCKGLGYRFTIRKRQWQYFHQTV